MPNFKSLLQLEGRSQRGERECPTRGFALVPLLVLLTLLSSITSIMTIETVSASRLTEAARRGRKLDIKRRAAAIAHAPAHSPRSLMISPSSPGYQIVRYNRAPLSLSGIPLSRYLDHSLPCTGPAADTTSRRTCTTIPQDSPEFLGLQGGLMATSLTIPEATRFLYVRGSVRVGNLVIFGPSLTISALGSITIGSVSSPRRVGPTLLLLSRTHEYKAPTTPPGGISVINGSSLSAASLNDTAVFPQPQSTIIGMRFPG